MAPAVYILCTLTSALCAVLLLRQHRSAPSALLLWSGISFCAMAVANALVFADLVILPASDLLLIRAWTMFIAAALLVYGLIWETD
jgi:hypothetical protein